MIFFKIKPQRLMIVSMLMMTYVITSSLSQFVEFRMNQQQDSNVSSHHRTIFLSRRQLTLNIICMQCLFYDSGKIFYLNLRLFLKALRP